MCFHVRSPCPLNPGGLDSGVRGSTKGGLSCDATCSKPAWIILLTCQRGCCLDLTFWLRVGGKCQCLQELFLHIMLRMAPATRILNCHLAATSYLNCREHVIALQAQAYHFSKICANLSHPCATRFLKSPQALQPPTSTKAHNPHPRHKAQNEAASGLWHINSTCRHVL